MAITYYGSEKPSLTVKANEETSLEHNHKHESSNRDLSRQRTTIAGCIGFFKSHMESTDDPDVKALCGQAVAEDKQLLKNIEEQLNDERHYAIARMKNEDAPKCSIM